MHNLIYSYGTRIMHALENKSVVLQLQSLPYYGIIHNVWASRGEMWCDVMGLDGSMRKDAVSFLLAREGIVSYMYVCMYVCICTICTMASRDILSSIARPFPGCYLPHPLSQCLPCWKPEAAQRWRSDNPLLRWSANSNLSVHKKEESIRPAKQHRNRCKVSHHPRIAHK